MAIPTSDLALIEAYCAGRVPVWARDQVQVIHTVRADTVTVIETRPPFDGVGDWTHRPIAQLRLDPVGWTLWWPDQPRRQTRSWPCSTTPLGHPFGDRSPEPTAEWVREWVPGERSGS